MAEGSTIRARAGSSKVVAIKICWAQSKTDRLTKFYPPDGVVDVERFLPDDSLEAERQWLRTQVLRALGLLPPEPSAPFDRLFSTTP